MMKKVLSLLFLSICMSGVAANSFLTLTKAFHWEVEPKVKDEISLELGRIVLFFNANQKKLEPKLVQKKTGNEIANQYRFTSFSVNGTKTEQIINQFNKGSSKYYMFRLDRKDDALMLTVKYNVENVFVIAREFPTISGKNGVELRFYDQGIIEKLKKASEVSMRVSSLKKKERLSLIVDMEARIQGLPVYLA